MEYFSQGRSGQEVEPLCESYADEYHGTWCLSCTNSYYAFFFVGRVSCGGVRSLTAFCCVQYYGVLSQGGSGKEWDPWAKAR